MTQMSRRYRTWGYLVDERRVSPLLDTPLAHDYWLTGTPVDVLVKRFGIGKMTLADHAGPAQILGSTCFNCGATVTAMGRTDAVEQFAWPGQIVRIACRACSPTGIWQVWYDGVWS